jgi:hypothetical protein
VRVPEIVRFGCFVILAFTARGLVPISATELGVTLRSIITVMSGSSLLNQSAQFPFAAENNDAWGRYTLRKQQYGNGMGMILGT